ncbi:MAG TPA: hypothetical protein VFH95_11980 [Candidatus Kapabacteria bacterium]|nr:hypothetical protein [Candidatus Kapabacteria bacterium]
MHRKELLIVLFFCGFAAAGCSRHLPPGEHNNFHPYAVSHATLHFEYFGNMRGSQDLFIDSFGAREAQIINSKLATEKGFLLTKTYSVRTGSNLVIVDSAQRVEVKLIDRPLDSIEHLLPPDIPTIEEGFRDSFVPPGYGPAGDTTVLGLKAHLWTDPNAPGYLMEWSGILIGSEVINPGNTHGLRLLSIDTTHPIDPARFIPPSGFPFHDLTKSGPAMPPPPLNP